MDVRTRIAFAALIAAQALHSIEEFRFRLFERLAPARAVSAFFSIDGATGFVVANTLLVGLGIGSLVLASRGGRAGRRLAWFWAGLEIANASAHAALAVAAGGYFPGLATAPLLLLAGAWLAWSLRRERQVAAAVP